MYWTEETILAAAPDALTYERARGLTGPQRWKHLHCNEQLAWGLCRSSGEAHYDVAAALQRPHFYCSCPSRKRPCKHVLALLLRYREEPDRFRFGRDLPLWLSEVRPTAAEAESPPPRSIDPAGLLNAERQEKMERGVEELERWLFDLVRQGLAAAERRDDEFWETAAASMVDAQLGGIGRRIRGWSSFFTAPDWPDRLLGEIGFLFLFIRAFGRREDLSPDAQIDLLNLAGVNLKKEEVLRGEGLRDRWLILASVEGTEERLRFRRSWLLGEESGRLALLLDFAWGNQGFAADWRPGTLIEGELVFYPSAYPLRALVRQYEFSRIAFAGLSGHPTLEAFADTYARALGADPWLLDFPCLLDDVRPLWHDGQLVMVDANQQMMKTEERTARAWRLIALGGGKPVLVFGEWDGRRLAPLTAFIENRMVCL